MKMRELVDKEILKKQDFLRDKIREVIKGIHINKKKYWINRIAKCKSYKGKINLCNRIIESWGSNK